MRTYDEPDEVGWACPCDDPQHEGPCPVCDACPCGCGAVAGPCQGDPEAEDLYASDWKAA